MTTTASMPAGDQSRIPGAALLVGVLGVIPFAAFAIGAWLHIEGRAGLAPGLARAALIAYGAVIVSFLGGVRWGVALRHDHPGHQASLFLMSVLPPLVAWGAIFMPRPHDLIVLIAAFLILGVSDVALAARGTAPRWYGKLRTGLTGAVVAILVLALALLPFAG
jgi:hypothetical protein